MQTPISDDERHRRIMAARQEAELLRLNPSTPRVTFWLSFLDPDRPVGQRSLGVAIIDDCVNIADAITQAHKAGCNPGGEVASHEVPPQMMHELDGVPRRTLMQKDELRRRGLIE